MRNTYSNHHHHHINQESNQNQTKHHPRINQPARNNPSSKQYDPVQILPKNPIYNKISYYPQEKAKNRKNGNSKKSTKNRNIPENHQNRHFINSTKNHNKWPRQPTQQQLISQRNSVDIFIHGLHPKTTELDIRTLFEPYCKIEQLSFRKNPYTGKHKGFAFFTVPSQEIADKIVGIGHYLHNRIVYCQVKEENPDRRTSGKRRLFIGGLPSNVSDWEIMEFFAKFGNLRTAYMIRDPKGRPKNFGFVDFKTEAGVEETIKSQPIFIKGKLIEIRRFKHKGKSEKAKKHPKRNANSESEEKEASSEWEVKDIPIEGPWFGQQSSLRSVMRISKILEFRMNTWESAGSRFSNIRLNLAREFRNKLRRSALRRGF